MEKQQEDIHLMKVRGGRGIVAVAANLYTTTLRRLSKKAWSYCALTATASLAAYILLLKSLFNDWKPGVFAAIALTVLSYFLELMLWLAVTNQLTGLKTRAAVRTASRHWGRLLTVVVIGVLLCWLFNTVLDIPVLVLFLAQWVAHQSSIMGDKPELPAYVPYLNGLVYLVTTTLKVLVRLYIVFVAYYAWGSAEMRQRERLNMKEN